MSGLSRISSSGAAAAIAAVAVAVAFVVALSVPRTAHAQGPRTQTIHVLSIDSDDADEQADALTNALRSHVRATPGWTLLETTQSLSMLTAAFQCPQRPDAACLERIGDKLKSDQFIWGVLGKVKVPPHQVSVEVHLWSRGKPDHLTKETFSDNLKDANDDNLKKVATQVFTKLLGAAGGTLAIHASSETGTVVVDGTPQGALDHGRLTIPLAAGSHIIEVQAPGFLNTRRPVSIEPSGSAQLEIVLEVDPNVAPVTAPGKPLPIRTIAGWSGIGVGVVLVAVGIGYGVGYLGDETDLNNARLSNYGGSAKSTPIADPCNPGASGGVVNGQTQIGCNAVTAANHAVVGEVTTFVIGAAALGTGIFLLVTDHPAAAADAPAPPAKTGLSNVHVVPALGPGGGSMVVLGQF